MKNIIEAVDTQFNNGTAVPYEMNELYAAIIRRGDRTKLHREPETDKIEYNMATYNNIVWRKNNYGETLFFDEDDEIFAVVRAKFGRIVVWDATIGYIFRPPSINQFSGQNIIFASFSANASKNSQKRHHFSSLLQDMRTAPEQNFVCSDSVNPDPEINFDKHLSLLRKNREGFRVAVFDELFPKSDLDELRTWTIKYGRYFFDDSLDVSSDNVQWIAGFNVERFVESRFWPVIRKMAAYISGKDTWYPYDVACNLIRTADHTRFHLDTSEDIEEEMTFLLYLSPNWTASDYGETAFMETNDDSVDNEYVAEVVPLYGRSVIFDGNFPHSARPPSVMHDGPRYTFAVKLSVDKLTAIRKTFIEESRHENGIRETLTLPSEVLSNPKLFTATFKISSVAQYMGMRVVQQKLDKSFGELLKEEEEEGYEKSDVQQAEDEERERSGQDPEEQGDEGEGDMPQVSQEDIQLLETLGVGEEQDLTLENHQNLVAMAKHHGVDKMLKEQEKKGPSKEHNDSLAGVFAEERREKIIHRWIKLSGKDPEKLKEYLDLYLKQQDWLRNYASKRMLTIL